MSGECLEKKGVKKPCSSLPELAGERVECYRNLHKDCFSVRRKGIVQCHAESLLLSEVTFHVSQKGRERVLREQRKNVHAYVKGILQGHLKLLSILEPVTQMDNRGWAELTYDPYQYSSFVLRGTTKQTIVNRADLVLLHGNRIWAYRID